MERTLPRDPPLPPLPTILISLYDLQLILLQKTVAQITFRKATCYFHRLTRGEEMMLCYLRGNISVALEFVFTEAQV